MRQAKILWIDDEIDLLKVQVMFLQEKGYEVQTANNGADAVEMAKAQPFDIIFLDENMPGLSGMETLDALKRERPSTPVVMVTKSEEEDLMDQAIGAKINDFLIKPVKPNQILLAIKKHVDTDRLIAEKTTSGYQMEFSRLGMEINEANSLDEWKEIYKKLVFWEMELSSSDNQQMDEVLKMQKSEANNEFSKFIQNHYLGWLEANSENRPLLSPGIFKEKVRPWLDKGEKVVFIVIDNFRYDQWKVLEQHIAPYFDVETEELYCSILPTATQYARNAIFAGLMPAEISQLYPDYWVSEQEEESKNNYEEQLLQTQLERMGLSIPFHYAKINNAKTGSQVVSNLQTILKNQLTVLVYNFIDMLSHARTEMNMIRELAGNEAAYRSITESWFNHSDLKELFKALADKDVKVVLTTDHGTIQVQQPIKVVGDRETTTNLRFKQGRNLKYPRKDVFVVDKPQKAHLPASNLSSKYIFARSNQFMAYPNNYNYYVKYYKNTFQHGGVSMEEMLIPLVEMRKS